MKRAGAKNDGAWFRTNKAIQKLNGVERTELAGKIAALPTSDAAFNALKALATETGVVLTEEPATKGAWVATMLNLGIPRQIWNGRLTTTTYAKTGDGKYVANYQSPMHFFAVDLRKVMRNFIFAAREVRDVFNIGLRHTGNPGGIPDADKTT